MKIKGMLRGRTIVLTAAVVFAGIAARAEDVELAKLFDERAVKGTIVIESLDGRTRYVHDDARAGERFLPASTFKILNTLIALDKGVIRDENEVIKWDGKDRGLPAWNRDQTLASAFPVSCVWFYQELARRVGNENYLRQLRELNYGNRKTGKDVQSFWLDGDLRISAVEQVAFLRKLVNDELPYNAQHVRLVKKMMIVEATPLYTLRAKTGMTAGIGWYVGYVETKDTSYIFALNIDILREGDPKYRQEIAREALKAKGIFKWGNIP